MSTNCTPLTQTSCSRDGREWSITKPSTDFRTWRLEAGDLVLKREDWRRINLDCCNQSSEVLDWIFHYRAKGLTPLELADMLEALEIILHPRKNLCSSGQDLRTDSRKLLQEHLKRGING